MVKTRNMFSAAGTRYKFKPYGPTPISTAKTTKGQFSINNTYACTVEDCHPTSHAFAHGTVTVLSDEGREEGKPMKRCANCMSLQFEDEGNNDDNVKDVIKDVGKIIKENTVVEVGPKKVKFTITGGSTKFIQDITTATKGRNTNHARLCLAHRQPMIRMEGNVRRKATPDEIIKSIKSLTKKGLFCAPIGSRVSSALSWPNARNLLLAEPVFNDLIKSIEDEGLTIVNGFCHAGAAGLGGVQDYHNDDFNPRATHRSVFQFSGGQTRKMMTMIHRKEGRHVSFLTPHGSVVHLSKEGAGADCTHELQHRLDGGDGSFAVILETCPNR